MNKKIVLLIAVFFFVSIFCSFCTAQVHFGITSMIKNKVQEVKQKKSEKVIVNHPPVISSLTANPTTVSTGAVSVITCIASDPDGDTLSYNWTATGGTISGSGSQVNWTAPTSTGTYTITCTVSDGKGGSVQASTNVVVRVIVSANHPPVISSLTANPTTVLTGAVSVITCVASDPDGDTLSYNWTATGGTISGSGSQVNWTAPTSTGTYTITCTVSDGKGGTDVKSVSIEVVLIKITLVGKLAGGLPRSVFVSGNYAYVAAEGILSIIDISNPSNPKQVGYYDTPGWACCGVYVLGNYAYVADTSSGLRVINISNPASPTEVGYYDTPGWAYGVYVSGNYAYVADGNSGLRVIDISNPASPTEVGYYDTPGYACGVYVSGNYAYVADDHLGLRVIDISNPASPTEVGYYDTPGYAYGVYVSGNYAYVADRGSGLRVIDISNPASPSEVGYYDTPGEAWGVYVSGNYAYVADYGSGLRVINISNPALPYEVGYYDTPGEAHGAYVSGNYVYVADYGLGLWIFKIE